MTCTRCDGLMVLERFEDIKDDTGQINFHAWHCLVCGEILDEVIITNRSNHQKPMPHRNRKLMVYN
jgi:hypothetical protein